MRPGPVRWHDYISNDRVLREAGLREVTCIVRERQLRLYGHVARLLVEDPAHRNLSCRDPSDWTMPTGRPQASWLRHVVSYLKDMGVVDLCVPGRLSGGGRRRTIARSRGGCSSMLHDFAKSRKQRS